MGYTTEFSGRISIDPPLSVEEFTFLKKFSDVRHVKNTVGPYFLEDRGPLVINHNLPVKDNLSLYCQWVPTDDGKFLEWDGSEKFYESENWMKFLMGHFLGQKPAARHEFPFLQGHMCNGTITAQGEDPDDRWELIVEDTIVRQRTL